MTKNKKIISILLLVIFSILEIILVCSNPFKELELYAEDIVYQNASAIPNNIKIIAIDEKTLADLGPYNDWDRAYFAKLIDILYSDENSEPKVLAFDVIFSGTNSSEADSALVASASKHQNIICASKLEIASNTEKDGDKYYRRSYVASEIGAYEELDAVTTRGFVTPVFDVDGYTRRSYGSFNSNGSEYVSFAYQVARMAGFEGTLPPVFDFLYSGNPGEFEVVSMSKVLDGSIKPSYFKDSIVLVGAYEEGMMDSYSVPITHSMNMYGVEIQANEIAAILNNKVVSRISTPLLLFLSVVLVLLAGAGIVSTYYLKTDFGVLIGSIALYIALCFGFKSQLIILPVIYFPLCIILLFITDLVVEYIITQKEKTEEMQTLLFSMADSMAEAIEGRTPYNANHTKNVAKRSIEMLDYINEMHKHKQTDLHFSKDDRKQLYLAAMLHDIGKMDVPLEVMDKPTRLGEKRKELVSRLNIIKLHLLIDKLEGTKTEEYVSKEVSDIENFLGQLDGFDCGRPLKEDEMAFIDDISHRTYEGEETIPYFTEEEITDLHIKAGTLSDEEREIMKSHVVYTDRILSHINFGNEFDRVRKMAADHHELMNGQGYPSGKKAEDLDALTRILTIMDIYDSLVADDRPYKKAKPIPVAFDILDEEAQKGKVDKDLLAIAKAMLLKEE